jgi:hypothetical protein
VTRNWHSFHKEIIVHILNNEKLIKTRTSWSSRLMLAGFGLILGSAVLTFLNPTNPSYILPAYAALFGGFIVFNMGASSGAKWRLLPRPDQALARTLKGLDHRHRLYNYLLPAEHVLLTPTGLALFQVRRMAGVISCTGAKWYHKKSILSRLRFSAEEQVGDPTRDAQQDVVLMRQFLDKNLNNADLVPVNSLILFTHPNVQLTVTDPTIPVLTAKDAKDYIRREVAEGAKLDQDTYDVLADIFDEAQGAEEVAMPDEPESPAAKAKRRAAKKG